MLAARGRRIAAVAVGAAVALAATLALRSASLLDGPVLAGGSGFGECVLVITVATAIGLAAALRPRLRLER